MPLECTMVCLDNSEWMRNGDYIPTRLDAQQDAANLVSNAKTQQNPENTVGVLSMAGLGRHSGATLLASPWIEGVSMKPPSGWSRPRLTWRITRCFSRTTTF